jgi:hypothetical protein
MKSRRDFFRQFVGQMGVLRDDFRGVECIPLNRLNELPDNIIKQIRPVFFPEENWELKDMVIYCHKKNRAEDIRFELDATEFKALLCFKKNLTLEQTAFDIRNNSELSYEKIYQTVTSLFFRLASLSVCHPRDPYPINEILNPAKTVRNGSI